MVARSDREEPMSSSVAPYNILLALEDSGFVARMNPLLEGLGFSVVSSHPDGLLDLLNDEVSVVVTTTGASADSKGFQRVKQVREKAPDTQIILLSEQGTLRDTMHALAHGALWYLHPPFNPDDLIFLIQKACIQWELKHQNRILRASFSTPMQPVELVAQSVPMRRISELVERISKNDATLLVTGESGTGKTAIARLIHQKSARSSHPFVSVSCAALPRELLEAELFGHERGAFTGAVTSRPGYIEMAQGGTLFLDEIGDLPIELQPKLLTFLQDRTIRRIGGGREIKVDVRVIAATNRDLRALCKSREFREDLYFRLNVLSIVMPPLRERREDIDDICRRYLKKLAAKREINGLAIESEAANWIRSYSWPGNVRELENCLERAATFCDGGVIRTEDLNEWSVANSVQRSAAESELQSSLAGLTLAEIEIRALKDTLEACGGNKTEAAKILGVSLKSVYNMMKRVKPDKNGSVS